MELLFGDYRDAEAIKRVAKRGDILEFHRGLYSHYSLYLGSEGDHMVINVSAVNKFADKALIELLPLEKICKNSKVKISNHDDIAEQYYDSCPRSPDEILLAASKYLEMECEYGFMRKNCEYYCTLWRFGVGFSTQVYNGISLSHNLFTKGHLSFVEVQALSSYSTEEWCRFVLMLSDYWFDPSKLLADLPKQCLLYIHRLKDNKLIA